MMSVAEAVAIIDEHVADGARLTIVDYPPETLGGSMIPGYSTVRLRPVLVGGARAHPMAIGPTRLSSIIGMAELLLRWRSA